MIIMLGLMVVAFIALSSFSKRSAQKRQVEHERMLAEQLVPGAWVHTSVGFFGRFVDLDGNVVILETPSGEETYWDKRVIRSVGELPFETEETEIEEVEEYSDEEGHEEPNTDTDTNEDRI
ncbi:preprotein translocase subunit YajC [Scrofimicrobium sp. R131]|uniref:Preprotein translocase subunit YajC n=1 Tax=Scrofimicrobium appendicitidis TaxID=3079930 RepID=A0AAU7V9L4_9ACTO